MHSKWTAFVCALTLALAVSAAAQDSGSSNTQDTPVLKLGPRTGRAPEKCKGK
jgi:hypothetical protein